MPTTAVGGGQFRLERCGLESGALARLASAGVHTAEELLGASALDAIEAGLLPGEAAVAGLLRFDPTVIEAKRSEWVDAWNRTIAR